MVGVGLGLGVIVAVGVALLVSDSQKWTSVRRSERVALKHAFGAAPISYHRALRLKRAAMLLADGSSVAEAAEATGYSDPVALSHAFRRKYGAPPHLWARQLRAS